MKINKLVIILAVVCCISGISLSFIYTTTKPRILKNKQERELKIKQEIMNAKNFLPVKEITAFSEVYRGDNEKDEFMGLLIKEKCRGYGGDIEYLVGLTAEIEPRIINIKILSHRETPGLGAKVSSEKFLSQFKGKPAEKIFLKKDLSSGEIDGITGATITSRAITSSIRAVLTNQQIKEYIKEKTSPPIIPLRTKKSVVQTLIETNEISVSTVTVH